jgi:hypothetical protein
MRTLGSNNSDLDREEGRANSIWSPCIGKADLHDLWYAFLLHMCGLEVHIWRACPLISCIFFLLISLSRLTRSIRLPIASSTPDFTNFIQKQLHIYFIPKVQDGGHAWEFLCSQWSGRERSHPSLAFLDGNCPHSAIRMSSAICSPSDAYLTASQVLTLLVMILSAFASSVFGAGYVSFRPSVLVLKQKSWLVTRQWAGYGEIQPTWLAKYIN